MSALLACAQHHTTPAGVIALTVGLGALGLALFGAGFVAFVRAARQDRRS